MRSPVSQTLGMILFLGFGSAALADDYLPGEEPPVPRIVDLPGVDYPVAQGLDVGRSLYIDETYETSRDLSTFSWVTGHGSNYRTAVGGTLQFGELRLAAEIPVHYTILHIDTLQEQPTVEQDREKAAFSLGDIVAGASYLWKLPVDDVDLRVGLGARIRIPNHTTQFTFLLASGHEDFTFGFPYYLHLAQSALVVASIGILTFRMDQGVLSMLASDVTLQGIRTPIPNLYFWESHYTAAARPIEWLAFGLELASFIQLNQVDDQGLTTLHGVKAVMLNPGVTFSFQEFRVSLAGRFGLTRGTQDFGVITFSGERAYLARLWYLF